MSTTSVEVYRISSNKRQGAYFLQGLQDPAFKQDQAFMRGLALISKIRWTYMYNIFLLWRTYVVFECFLQETSGQGSGGLYLCSKNTFCEAVGLFSFIWCSKRQSFNWHQRAFTWQIDRSTNSRLLNTNFAVKLHVHAVCDARPLQTLAFIWNPVLISYRAMKPPAFTQDPAFIQIQRLFEEIRYMYMASSFREWER